MSPLVIADRTFRSRLMLGTGKFSSNESMRDALDALITPLIDRPLSDLSPIERAVMWLGVYELEHCLDVPWRVVVNEAVTLTRKYGATDAHKYVNAVLDKAARTLRPHES